MCKYAPHICGVILLHCFLVYDNRFLQIQPVSLGSSTHRAAGGPVYPLPPPPALSRHNGTRDIPQWLSLAGKAPSWQVCATWWKVQAACPVRPAPRTGPPRQLAGLTTPSCPQQGSMWIQIHFLLATLFLLRYSLRIHFVRVEFSTPSA